MKFTAARLFDNKPRKKEHPSFRTKLHKRLKNLTTNIDS